MRSSIAARLSILLLIAVACKSEKPQAWKPLPLGTSADFRSVFFADAQHGWIGGGAYNIIGGLIGRTSDGGKSWTFTSSVAGTHQVSSGQKIEAMHFFDAERGVAAVDRGKFFTTSDGGENWGEIPRWPGTTDYIFDLHFLDENVGWSAGLAGVLRTDDGGQHWVPLAKKNEEGRIEGRSIAFFDESNGILVGQHASVLSTSDGGLTWSRVELPLADGEHPDFWDVVLVDESEGWICGEEGTLLHTTDGGATWSLQPLGIEGVRSAPKLEEIQRNGRVEKIDAGDRTPGLTLAALVFTDPKTGWIAGHFANMGRSLILRTVDGGKTWTVDADIEGEELRVMFALDADHLWAIGERTRPGAQAIFYRGPSSAN